MLIDEKLVFLNMPVRSKEDAIKKLADRVEEVGRIKNKQSYIDAVFKRESDFSTGVGFGVAIPHGKSDAVLEPFLAFATVHPMNWESMDGNPVDLIFLIGVPKEDKGETHLKILAALSRKLMKESFRDALRKVNSPQELIVLLRENQLLDV